jgi:hypothetical protein
MASPSLFKDWFFLMGGMTPLVYTNAAFDTTVYIRHLIYVMNNIRFIFIILALLQLAGCQKAPRTGEAFLVTKSGDTKYMADMLVLGFDQKFISEYSDWNTKRVANYSKDLEEFINKDTSTAEKIKTIENLIKDNDEKIKNNLITAEKIVSVDRIDSLKRRRSFLSKQLFDAYYKNSYDSIKQEIKTIDYTIDQIQKKDTYYKQSVENESKVVNEPLEDINNKGYELINDLKKTRLDAAQKYLIKSYKKDFYDFVIKHMIFSNHTGSKGEFTIPNTVSCIFAERELSDDVDAVWFIQLYPDKNITLSNSNIISSVTSREVVLKYGYTIDLTIFHRS